MTDLVREEDARRTSGEVGRSYTGRGAPRGAALASRVVGAIFATVLGVLAFVGLLVVAAIVLIVVVI
jgi:hypothetical protein